MPRPTARRPSSAGRCRCSDSLSSAFSHSSSTSFWVGLIGEGISLAIIFLSITLVTGEGGMIWLCQATFAGIGALTTAQLAGKHGWPVMAAVVVGGLVAVPFGVLIGVLTIRLGNLYVALVTLTVGLLFDDLIFSQQIFVNFGIGVNVNLRSYRLQPEDLCLLGSRRFCDRVATHRQLATVIYRTRPQRGSVEHGGFQDDGDQRAANEGTGCRHRGVRRWGGRSNVRALVG